MSHGLQVCKECGEGTYEQPCGLCQADEGLFTPPQHVAIDKPRPEFLDLALKCGADLTGKPDGSEAVTVVFSIEAWAKFDLANRK